MDKNYLATSAVVIDASPQHVWDVITDPVATREFMFGTEVVTDWRVGGPIRWRGTWKGKDYEDKGEILEFEPSRRLVTTHFSAVNGDEDVPANYHTLTWTLESEAGRTRLILTQDNNESPEAAAHSQGMWDSLVTSVKAIAERG